MNFGNSPDQQIFKRTYDVVTDKCLNFGSDVIGVKSDDVIVTPDAVLMKKPDIDADVAYNNLNNYKVSIFSLFKVKK